VTKLSRKAAYIPFAALLASLSAAAGAEQLYEGGSWPALASDDKANGPGDIVIVLIQESAQASSRLQNNSSKNTDFGGSFAAGGIDEGANLSLGGSYAGRGEVVRSEQFVASMSAQIAEILPNGDFLIEGKQLMLINGEETTIGVRGRIRPQDISPENAISSFRIADAQINYDGKGFVSRSAKPGLINRILSFLGLG
jgi:flagellar L-ring protein precursor FlgH